MDEFVNLKNIKEKYIQ